MDIYSEMRGVAAEVFGEFAQGVIQWVGITPAAGATPDRPGTPTKAAPVTLNATARPVSTKYVDGSTIVQTDKQVTIPNDGKATPSMSGFLRIDGVDHKTIAIMPRPAAGEPITWTVIVRR